jgi:hypothetical protein
VVAAALLIDGEGNEGAAEIRVLKAEDFREWHASDKSAAALRQSARKKAAPARQERGSYAVSAGDYRLSAQDSRPGAADSGSFGGGMDEPSVSFLDGGSEPLRARADEAPAAQSAPTTGGFLGSAADGSDPPSGGFGFALEEGAHDSAIGAFSLNDASPPAEPAPPMLLPADDDADDATADTAPQIAPPMMLADDTYDDTANVAPPRGPAPPMMIADDEDGPSEPAAPDDTHAPEDGGGLLGEVTASDPFEAERAPSSVGLEKVDSAFGPAKDEDTGNISMLHSTYQGEMELVGMAGFSLVGGEGADDSNPFHDPTEQTGFFDERMSATPRRMDDETVPGPSDGKADGAMVRELIRLLRGYVVVFEDGSHTFGLPDGGLLRDAYTHDGDELDAYVGFLKSKVAEGFIPRADRVVTMIPGVRPSPIDANAIEKAAGQAGL